MEIETEFQSTNQLVGVCDWLQSVTYSHFSSYAMPGKTVRKLQICLDLSRGQFHSEQTNLS